MAIRYLLLPQPHDSALWAIVIKFVMACPVFESAKVHSSD
eukprot:CAMPEP_0116835482 /NCGR_PEP_ID=MMETSP0418-20121206/7570_1 /TAXON_ID=1158023 /ORGANISM="Astrosyne radiata, Strain 13vi08-1A" /LENGTH=39 /DNA_ID= /DNA_START= /DNA_END= /DNA_ORIENTATION=